MIKCPFCHYDNEDGALFCEQCKSDLAGVEPVTAAAPLAGAPVAAAEVVETVPVVAVPVPEGVPVVETVLAEPVMPSPGVVEAVPVESITPIPLAPEVQPVPAVGMAPPSPVATAATGAAPVPIEGALPPTTPVTPSAPTAVPVAAPTTPAVAPAAPSAVLPPDAQPRLLVLRGLKRNVEYPLYEGHNFIGRADEKPVDIDLEDQEPPDRIWSSRQHAVITFENGRLVIEDLNSSNGTFVNRSKIHPGQKRDLNVGDVIQIGTVQLKVII